MIDHSHLRLFQFVIHSFQQVRSVIHLGLKLIFNAMQLKMLQHLKHGYNYS